MHYFVTLELDLRERWEVGVLSTGIKGEEERELTGVFLETD